MTGRLLAPSVVAAAAPPRVQQRIAAAVGPAPIVHRGLHALYVRIEGFCVGVVSGTASAVPCALRIAGPDLGRLAATRSAYVDAGRLFLDSTAVSVRRLLDVGAPKLEVDALRRLRVVRGSADSVAAELPPAALRLLATGDPAAALLLVGNGSGLTPLGDDVLAGWLALHHAVGAATPALEDAVVRNLHRTTTLSATLLDCALRGEVLPEYAEVLRALPGHFDGSGQDRLRRAADELVRIGHTSGAGLLLGMRLGLDHLTSQTPQAPLTPRRAA